MKKIHLGTFWISLRILGTVGNVIEHDFRIFDVEKNKQEDQREENGGKKYIGGLNPT